MAKRILVYNNACHTGQRKHTWKAWLDIWRTYLLKRVPGTKQNQQRSRFLPMLEEYEGMFKKKLPLSFGKITYNHVNSHNFVSCVCHYIGNKACQYVKDNKDLLAWKAADQYLSVFKTYF
eukprot:10893684-Ditylum_brightwellii.AAC.1